MLTTGILTKMDRSFLKSVLMVTICGVLGIRFEPHECPLQCKFTFTTPGIYVECMYGDFKEIPNLPLETAVYAMSGKSKLEKIQDNFWSQYQLLESVSIKINNKINLQKGVLQGLNKYFRFKSTVPIEINGNVFNNLQVRKMALYLLKPDILTYLCNQTHLTELDVSRNNFPGIKLPNCFAKLRKLIRLQIDHNPLKVIREHDFDALQTINLQEIHLSYCDITNVQSNAFRKLTSLKKIILSQNRLKILPDSLLHGLHYLKEIHFASNQVMRLPCKMFNTSLPFLNFVDLNYNGRITEEKLCFNFSNSPHLRTVYLAGVKIEKVDDNSLAGLREISKAILSVSDITPSSFSTLKKLDSLSLVHGNLNMTGLANIIKGLSITPIKELAVKTTLNVLSNKLFLNMRNSTLKSLKLSHCGLKMIENRALSPLCNLENIDLSNNALTDILDGTFRDLKVIKILDLSKNRLKYFYPILNRWSLQPSIIKLSITDNIIGHVPPNSIKHLTNLVELYMDGNKITTLHESLFDNPSLMKLSLQRNNIHSIQNRAFSNLPSLTILRLQHNKVTFEAKNGLPFSNNTNLKEINLLGSLLSVGFERHLFRNLFEKLSKLALLNMASGNIRILPEDLFHRNNRLTELIISKNEIKTWSPNIFKNLGLLDKLILASNQIVTITKKHFTYLMALRELDLSDNPLMCNCDLLWFREWLPKVHIYIANIGSYKCAAPDIFRGTPLLDFNLPESECKSYIFLKLSLTFTAAIALVLTATGIVFKFRFEINLLIFHLKSRQSRLLNQASEQEEYDGFVVYAGGDLQWIIGELIPQIEESRGYKLCIEDRDWMGGVALIDNVMRSIESSRKVLCIISPNFTAAPWCEEVLEIAQSHLAGRNRTNLIPVVLQEPEAEQMTPALRTLLSSFSCLYWPNEPKIEKRFWSSLNSALKK